MAAAVRASGRSRGFTIVELLVVIVIISLLVGITVPAVSAARDDAKSSKCASQLHSIAQLIHSFLNDHNDYCAAAVRERDYRWDKGKQIGWDIETGRWANVPGGTGSVWRCPKGGTAYVANTRAVGLDARQILKRGKLWQVGPRQWHEPARLALVYDLQTSRITTDYPHAVDPLVGDLSDEIWTPWPRQEDEPLIGLGLPIGGPHREAYGAAFADGHARVARYSGVAEVLWSGRRWWSATVNWASERDRRPKEEE